MSNVGFPFGWNIHSRSRDSPSQVGGNNVSVRFNSPWGSTPIPINPNTSSYNPIPREIALEINYRLGASNPSILGGIPFGGSYGPGGSYPFIKTFGPEGPLPWGNYSQRGGNLSFEENLLEAFMVP
jgi:hypothetical protein